jgi:organic radical activating enzyme
MSRNDLVVNDIFYSIQGEGVRAGTMNLFLRLSGCNATCNGTMEDQAYLPVCDTEFVSGRRMTWDAIVARFHELAPACRWVILTGGEPALQLTPAFTAYLHGQGYQLAIETNGTINVDALGLDWVCVSPKVAEHAIKQQTASEVKYVRNYGQGIPKTVIEAGHYVLSPAFEGEYLDPKTLAWCLQLCKDNPTWRLSLQLHKVLQVR